MGALLLLEVRAKEDGLNRRGRYICGRDPVTGDPLVWNPGWEQRLVDESVLPELEADGWLEIRRIDPRLEAAKRMEMALAADAVAADAEKRAKDLRAAASKALDEAQAALDAIGNEPPPAPAALPTPYADSKTAASPGVGVTNSDLLSSLSPETRAELDRLKAQRNETISQINGGSKLQATPPGALAQEQSKALGQTPADTKPAAKRKG